MSARVINTVPDITISINFIQDVLDFIESLAH